MPGREDAASGMARLNKPLGLAVSGSGIVYVSFSDGILKGTPVQ